MLINALNFIKRVLEANLDLYTLICLEYELISDKAVQVNSEKEPSPPLTQTRQRSIRNGFFSGKNLTLEQLKLIIFCQMYKSKANPQAPLSQQVHQTRNTAPQKHRA